MHNIPDDCVNHPNAPWNENPVWFCEECGCGTEEDELICDDCYEEIRSRVDE